MVNAPMAFLELLLRWGQYFLIAFVIGFPLNFLVGVMTHGRRWVGSLGKALFIPGAIIHELGHAVACLVTGKRITGTNFGTNPMKGGSVNFEMTGICTPLALHAVAYAPVISCGIVTAAILNYISLNEMYFEIMDYAIWIYLLISVAAGAAPSGADMRIAFHSLSARPRVTAVEVISLAWPILLPDLLGLSSDIALLAYLIAMVCSYIVLWKLLVSPHPHGIRQALGIKHGLPGDGRDSRGERWPIFTEGRSDPALPRVARYPHGVDISLPVATAEDVYRAAGLKFKSKKSKLDMEVMTDA